MIVGRMKKLIAMVWYAEVKIGPTVGILIYDAETDSLSNVDNMRIDRGSRPERPSHS